MTDHADKSRAKDASFLWDGIGGKLAYASVGSLLASALAAWWLGVRSIGGLLGCFVAIHLVLMYFVGGRVVREDKRRAGSNAWRVPESTILAIAAAGGSIGVLRAMYKYRHKTKHAKFYLGVPFILFVQANILLYLFFPDLYSRLVHIVV